MRKCDWEAFQRKHQNQSQRILSDSEDVLLTCFGLCCLSRCGFSSISSSAAVVQHSVAASCGSSPFLHGDPGAAGSLRIPFLHVHLDPISTGHFEAPGASFHFVSLRAKAIAASEPSAVVCFTPPGEVAGIKVRFESQHSGPSRFCVVCKRKPKQTNH